MKKEINDRTILPNDPTSGLRAGGRTARYVAENPKRMIKEMKAMTSFEITDLIKMLRGKGIMFSVISGVDDPLFPVNRQIDQMRKNESLLPLEGYYSVVGGHNESSINSDKHAALAAEALKNL